MNQWIPDPGVYVDILAEEYHSCPYESNSHLAPMIRRSPLHYLEQERVDSTAFQFGRLAHSMVLEPATLLDSYVVLPDFVKQVNDEAIADGGQPYKSPRGTKRYHELCDAFATENASKQIVSTDDLTAVRLMRKRAVENSLAAEWLESKGHVEVSIVWDDDIWGTRCKGRLDKWLPEKRLILDYKTTDWPPQFETAIHRYDYHVQAAFYRDGLVAAAGLDYLPDFGIIAQEKTPPYTCLAAIVDSQALLAGKTAYRNALEKVVECTESGVWPGPENPDAWRLPEWAQTGPTVSFEGI